MRRSLPLLSALAERLAAPSAEPLVVSAKVAADVARRGPAMSHLPAEVCAAVDAAVADANRKAVRQRGRQLTDGLKRMSRTKHRGGVHPNFHDEPTPYLIERALRGKRRQQERRALADLTRHAALAVAEDDEDDAGIVQKYWDGEEEAATGLVAAVSAEAAAGAAAAAAAGGALYREEEALAYAVTRMPACYAALHRVMLEAAAAAPMGWRPDSILDFGAGPGTAAWAAHAVWSAEGQPPLQVTAVEPSGAMAWLGQDIQRRLGEARALRAVEAASKDDNDGMDSNEVDESEVGGVEEELLAPPPLPPPAVRWMTRLMRSKDRSSDRRRRMNDNYASPGRKYDVVVAGYVLGEVPTPRERRRLVADLWARTGRFLILVEPGTPAGSSAIQAARTQVLTQEGPRGGGAHVAAPCPHDGPCPLEGLQSWCHFSQRFERPAAARRAKAVAGKLPPRSHQDERFSYVILARGVRPPPPPQVAVAGSPTPEVPGAELEFLNVPEDLRPRRVDGDSGERWEEEEEEGSEGYSSSGSEWDEVESDESWEEGSASEEEGEEEEVSSRGAGALASKEEIAAEMRRMLLESMGAEKGDELPPELEQVVQRTAEEAMAQRGGDSSSDSALSSDSSYSDDEDEEEGGVAVSRDPGMEGPEAEAAAQAASVTWSRLLRTPRKRSGHVVLDLCSAVDADGQHLGGRKGALLRQIVSRAKAERATGGVMPFKLARKARWGDVWPADLQAKLGAFEPPAGLEDVDAAAATDTDAL